jgi:peptidoglycan/xylan/chitin deacetylase (PgdA/CDA1 family)
MPTTKTAGPAITPGIGKVTRVLTGIGLAAFVLPLLAVIDDHSAAVAGTALPGLVIAAGAAGLVWWRRQASASALGGVVVAACAWLFSQARAGSINWLLAALLGLGIALALPRPQVRDRLIQTSAGVFAAVLVAVAAVRDAGTAWTIGILTGVTLIVVALGRPAVPGRAGWLLPVTGLLGILLLGSWIGANSPTADWFGPTIAHGPRSRPQVAITFDDGPNSGATLMIAHLLDAHGAKGTFFTVGKAVDSRPDITRELIEDGQLIGNHSYHHDEWRWLDPRYPELMRAQHAIREQTGVCPAFYRPPHGQHTPFMAWVMGQHHVRMVGWDVSAGDWATNDPYLIARRVLDYVRPGSIIDLHDGLDGEVNADRTVLVRAMPLILDGLQARGLQPVRLDQLLGRSGYTDHC